MNPKYDSTRLEIRQHHGNLVRIDFKGSHEMAL